MHPDFVLMNTKLQAYLLNNRLSLFIIYFSHTISDFCKHSSPIKSSKLFNDLILKSCFYVTKTFGNWKQTKNFLQMNLIIRI